MHILIVDDEKNIRKTLTIIFKDFDCDIKEAGSFEEADSLIKGVFFDFAVVDIRLPDGSGVELLKKIKNHSPDTIVLIITAFASTETAVDAMRSGAYDYITKPFNIDEIRIIFKNIIEKIFLQKKVKELQRYEDEYQSIIGKSIAMKKVFDTIEKIAFFDSSVIIIGESGTGKELVAKAIHNKSRRSNKPYIAINCASLPGELLESELFGYMKGAFTGAYSSRRGLIEEANCGSLFLDEIGEMPASIQAKLLRFLEDKKIRPLGGNQEINVDVRIIAATNKDFPALLNSGSFREDLYYRLATFEIKLPSLKERLEDIPLLITHFVKVISERFNKKIVKIEPQFIDSITNTELRGNVRELKNIIEREIILSEDGHLRYTPLKQSETNTPRSLIDILDFGFNLNKYLAEIEKDMIKKALIQSGGVKTKAAELLGLSFREFRYRLDKYKDIN